ncbi:MAG: hypothetical protein IKK21_07470 [Clostridia bacterium]|nr:hypothetical protein [Clostridia bacterium]
MTDRNDSSHIQEYLRQTDRYFSDAKQTLSLIAHQRPSSVPTPPTPARKPWLRVALICAALLVAIWLLMPPQGTLDTVMDVFDDHIQLSWKLSNAIGTTYRIERRLGSDTELQVLADGIRGNFYIDRTVGSGDSAEYWISACKYGFAFVAHQHILGEKAASPVALNSTSSSTAKTTPTPPPAHKGMWWVEDCLINTSEDDMSTDLTSASRAKKLWFHATVGGADSSADVQLWYELVREGRQVSAGKVNGRSGAGYSIDIWFVPNNSGRHWLNLYYFQNGKRVDIGSSHQIQLQ